MHREGRKIEVEGARLHVQFAGRAEGSPLLFLHGGAGTLDDFDVLIDNFADHHCVLVDSRGHGASILGDAPLSYPALAADVEAVIAALDLVEPVIIGHSDGGIIGLIIAANGLCALGGLITLGSHASPPPPDLLDRIYAKVTAQSWRAKFPEGVALYEQLNPEPDFDRLLETLLAMWTDTTPGNYPGMAVSHVSCPTLILGGDADHLVPRALTEQLATYIPQAALGIIPYGSHIMHQEQPERIVPLMLDFLERAAG